MDIFEALRRDHDKQRTLTDLLVQTRSDGDGRGEIFARLKAELMRHASAEERHFYVPLIDRDLTQLQARHCISVHREIEELIDELESTDRNSPGWLETAKRLQRNVERHIDEEEREIFQAAGRVLTDRDKVGLAQEYRLQMKTRR